MLVRRVNNFCFFFNLRSSTLIFLWIVLVLSIVLSFVGLFLYTSQFGKEPPEPVNLLGFFLPFWLYFILLFGILPYGMALYGVYKKELFYVELCTLVNMFALVSWVVTLVVFVLLVFFSKLQSMALFDFLLSWETDNTKQIHIGLQLLYHKFQPQSDNATADCCNLLCRGSIKELESLQNGPIGFKLYMWICVVCLAGLITLQWYFTCVIHSYYLLVKQERRSNGNE